MRTIWNTLSKSNVNLFRLSLCHTRYLSRYANYEESLCQNPILLSKLRLILAEYQLLKHTDPDNVPSELSNSDLDYLMSLSKIKRFKRLTWVDISYQLRQKELKQLKKLENVNGNNQLCLPITGRESEKLVNRLQCSLIPYLQNIAFDISFDDYMSSLECKNLVEQLLRIFNLNKIGKNNNINIISNIFNLHVTNLKSSKITKPILKTFLKNDFNVYYPNVFLHDDQFTEIFKQNKIIYLSPHAEETMTNYDHEAVYIIGGIVDRRQVVNLTQTKCKQMGIKTLKLPLESLVNKEVQSLDDVFKIIQELKNYKSFDSSVIPKVINKQIPHRKIVNN